MILRVFDIEHNLGFGYLQLWLPLPNVPSIQYKIKDMFLGLFSNLCRKRDCDESVSSKQSVWSHLFTTKISLSSSSSSSPIPLIFPPHRRYPHHQVILTKTERSRYLQVKHFLAKSQETWRVFKGSPQQPQPSIFLLLLFRVNRMQSNTCCPYPQSWYHPEGTQWKWISLN